MKKQIIEYIDYIESEIASLQSEMDTNHSLTQKRINDLITFNNQRIRDFQHERLVHLFVMLFFGILCIASFIGFFMGVSSQNPSSGDMMQTIALAFTSLLLVVVEIFYVKHYYFLENAVQKIYKYEKQLHEINICIQNIDI